MQELLTVEALADEAGFSQQALSKYGGAFVCEQLC
jgi:hypothetical protein